MTEETQEVDAETESDGATEATGGKVDYNSHPSLSKTLEEMRFRYNDEEDRKRSIGTKIGIVLTVNAIIISYVITIRELSALSKTVILLLAFASAASCLYALRPRRYSRPGESIDDLPYEAFQEPHEFDEQFIWDYHKAVKENTSVNNSLLCNFNLSFYLTLFSGIVLLLASMI
ncbi:hypothetical protein [Natronococcus wangiae]|uniref:hypothetical protein n=1 Tax=Natronococcus wangiae TaxID=3068275 RepID=UPI00273F7D41|nr:hypothetical protein [Natronococcus sp. AD5]